MMSTPEMHQPGPAVSARSRYRCADRGNCGTGPPVKWHSSPSSMDHVLLRVLVFSRDVEAHPHLRLPFLTAMPSATRFEPRSKSIGYKVVDGGATPRSHHFTSMITMFKNKKAANLQQLPGLQHVLEAGSAQGWQPPSWPPFPMHRPSGPLVNNIATDSCGGCMPYNSSLSGVAGERLPRPTPLSRWPRRPSARSATHAQGRGGRRAAQGQLQRHAVRRGPRLGRPGAGRRPSAASGRS